MLMLIGGGEIPFKINWDFSMVWGMPGLFTQAAAMTSQLWNTHTHTYIVLKHTHNSDQLTTTYLQAFLAAA